MRGAAILAHAQAHSDWWQEGVSAFIATPEGALRYPAINALSPAANID
jgi:hypothetical protein